MPHIETEHKTSQRITPNKRDEVSRQVSMSISYRDDSHKHIMIFGTQKDRRDVFTESLSGLTRADLADLHACIEAALPLLEEGGDNEYP